MTGRALVARQAAVAAALVVAAATLIAAVLLTHVAFTNVDRPVFAVCALAGAAVLRAGRTAWKVHTGGVDAALPRPPEPLEPAPRIALDEHDRFFVAQRWRFLGDRYELAALGPDGRSAGEPVAVVERPPFQMRESFEALEPGPRRLFHVRALQILDVAGRYRVDDVRGHRIGELRKLFAASLLRSSWEVWDGAGTLVATATERSLPVALWRRGVDMVPVVGQTLGLLPVPYHFTITAPDGAVLGELRRLRTLRDRYALDLTGDPGRVLDRRLALALAVSLDALQSR